MGKNRGKKVGLVGDILKGIFVGFEEGILAYLKFLLIIFISVFYFCFFKAFIIVLSGGVVIFM